MFLLHKAHVLTNPFYALASDSDETPTPTKELKSARVNGDLISSIN